MRNVHSQNNAAHIKCDDCEKVFKNIYALKSHQKTAHLSIRYPCPKCEFAARSNSWLKVHIDSTHLGWKEECPYCDHKASTKSNLRTHIKGKHDGVSVKFECSKCDSDFSHKQSLKTHYKDKHLGVKHICSKCSFITNTTNNLRTHMAVHSDKLYSCDQCDKTFREGFIKKKKKLGNFPYRRKAPPPSIIREKIFFFI